MPRIGDGTAFDYLRSGESAALDPFHLGGPLVIDRVLSVTLGLHVLAGVVALLAGIVALVTEKGGSRHVRSGRAYAVAMGVVVVTAVPLAVVGGSWFLFALAVFSGYLVFAGYRALATKRPDGGAAVDLAGHGTMIVAGAGMIAWGGQMTFADSFALAPVLVVFGAIGAGLAVLELRRLRSPPEDPMVWFYRHVVLMGGGFIATVTAAVTVNLTMVPPLARWLGPTAVGVPLLLLTVRRYERQFDAGDSGTAA
ncbi:hypothetical protein BRC81_06825 [Halobacteriales archaeon QS_1_68_20]|nr:MAG: hypothetical protein BRC81_06825 [Halobacteriales archaeon QS_1_68_20]